MDKDQASKRIYLLVARLGDLQDRIAMDIIIRELGYEQVETPIPMIQYDNGEVVFYPSDELETYTQESD